MDIVDQEVAGPGRFVSPLEIMLMPAAHFVVKPLQASGHFEKPDGQVVVGRGFMVAIYDPAKEFAWTIGAVMGRGLFEYQDMHLVRNKSTSVLDKVRRDFSYFVPIQLIVRNETGWHAKFFPRDDSSGVPQWLQ
jgi:hypothetical protein